MTPAPLSHRTVSARRLRRAWLHCCALAALASLTALPVAAQAAPPDNDDFAAAQIARVGDRITGSTAEATLEAGEPATSSPLLTRTVWYRFTATVTETLRIDTCSSPRFAELELYTGAAVAGLTEVQHTDVGCSSTRSYFTATAGTTYHLRLVAYGEFNGDIVLNIARPQPPANDNFAGARAVGRPAHLIGSNVDATIEPGEPQPGFAPSDRSVWYGLRATSNDSVRVSTCDGGGSSQVAVYAGAAVGQLTEVGREGGACGYRSIMDFSVVTGTTYHIAVTGGQGDFILDVSAQDPAPPQLGNLAPPPAPTCPFVFGGDGPVYSGTHSGGGAVCVTLTKDFSGVAWFHAIDIPATPCGIGWHVERIVDLPAPIVDRRFGYGSTYSRIIGSFSAGREASGTMQITQPGPPTCRSGVLTWKATTRATPPWLDETPPALALRATAVQRPLRRHHLAVLVRCTKEACTVGASATVAGIRLKSAKLKLRKGAGRTLRLALSARSRRGIRAALRRNPSIRTRVTVVAVDAASNRTTARRTITLRR